jgi:hypothetical protein
MSIADEYLRRAEECERLANECVAESNRAILLYAAGRWRKMAEEEAGRPAPAKAMQGSDGLQDAGSVKDERDVAAGE